MLKFGLTVMRWRKEHHGKGAAGSWAWDHPLDGTPTWAVLLFQPGLSFSLHGTSGGLLVVKAVAVKNSNIYWRQGFLSSRHSQIYILMKKTEGIITKHTNVITSKISGYSSDWHHTKWKHKLTYEHICLEWYINCFTLISPLTSQLSYSIWMIFLGPLPNSAYYPVKK